MWYGFVIWDDRGLAIPFDEISERVHYSVRIFKVAGTSHRLAALQSPAFEPGHDRTWTWDCLIERCAEDWRRI